MTKPVYEMPEFKVRIAIDQFDFKLSAEITVNAHCREDAELQAEMVLQSKFGINFKYEWFVEQLRLKCNEQGQS